MRGAQRAMVLAQSASPNNAPVNPSRQLTLKRKDFHMVKNDDQAARVEPACYPSLSQYDGGCSILNGHTTIRNVLAECRECTPEVCDEVFRLLREGNEVFLLGGEIKAAGPY